MHNKKLYCTAESFTAQQTVLLHSRKFYRIAEKSVLRQKLEKSSFCGRNRGYAHFVASSLGLGLNVCAQTGNGKMVL